MSDYFLFGVDSILVVSALLDVVGEVFRVFDQ